MPSLKSFSKYYSASGIQRKINKKRYPSLEPLAQLTTLFNKGYLAMPQELDTLALILVWT